MRTVAESGGLLLSRQSQAALPAHDGRTAISMNRWDFLQCRRYDVKPGDRISVSLLLDDCFLSVNGCTFPELQPFYFMGFGKLPTIRLGKDGLTIF